MHEVSDFEDIIDPLSIRPAYLGSAFLIRFLHNSSFLIVHPDDDHEGGLVMLLDLNNDAHWYLSM